MTAGTLALIAEAEREGCRVARSFDGDWTIVLPVDPSAVRPRAWLCGRDGSVDALLREALAVCRRRAPQRAVA